VLLNKVADVISGNYNDLISSYTIVDCRFPYEYNGGHIKVFQYFGVLWCLHIVTLRMLSIYGARMIY